MNKFKDILQKAESGRVALERNYLETKERKHAELLKDISAMKIADRAIENPKKDARVSKRVFAEKVHINLLADQVLLRQRLVMFSQKTRQFLADNHGKIANMYMDQRLNSKIGISAFDAQYKLFNRDGFLQCNRGCLRVPPLLKMLSANVGAFENIPEQTQLILDQVLFSDCALVIYKGRDIVLNDDHLSEMAAIPFDRIIERIKFVGYDKFTSVKHYSNATLGVPNLFSKAISRKCYTAYMPRIIVAHLLNDQEMFVELSKSLQNKLTPSFQA